MKLYDLIKTILRDEPELRDSDKKLIWRVWETQNVLRYDAYGTRYLNFHGFMDSLSTETIRRTRQKVQENCLELRSCEKIQRVKDEKRGTKGTFVYKVKFPVEALSYAQAKASRKTALL
jgi:hypothetical protein